MHHKKFNKWTPPGGHIEENETPADAVKREFLEELSVNIEIIPAAPSAFVGDDNATPIPLPFHMDLEIEGFDVPHIGYFFYITLPDPGSKLSHQESEVKALGWFSKEDLINLNTFDQVKALAAYAIDHYPKNNEAV